MPRDTREDNDLRRAAIHQAGVVVVMARFNGLHWPTAAWLNRDGGMVQSCLDASLKPPPTDQEIWGEFAARHAGMVAERVILGSIATSAVVNVLRAEELLQLMIGTTAVEDPHGPSAIIASLAPTERRESGPSGRLTETLRIVEEFVRDDRDAIVDLARVLEARGRLEGQALRSVLDDVLAEASDG